MEFILIVLSWLILLVPGFDDSVPPTGDKIFKIETSPDIVESIKVQSDESFDLWGFDIELKQNSTGMLEVKIPKNLPTPASFTNSWHYDERPIVLTDGIEIGYDIISDPCYSHYKIPIEGKTNLEIVYTVILTGSWQLYSPIQFDKNNSCYNKVFYEKPLEPPLKQIKSGIEPKDVVCKSGLELVMKKSNDQPICIKGTSVKNLTLRGYIHEYNGMYGEILSSEITGTGVAKDSKIFDVKYLIKGATIQDMIFSNYTNSLVITIDVTHEGDLKVTVPRDLLDARMDYCPPRKTNAPDDRFFVLLDGEEIFDDEILTTVEARTLRIPFDINSEKIEIIGTCFV